MSSVTNTAIAPDGTAFDLTGPTDAPVLALIHGLGLCRELWRPHIANLSGQYRLLNYDLYGHGESAPSPVTASLSVYADQLAKLLDHLNISTAAIIGFSIGGMINRRFALDYPNKVSSLVILNSPHDRGDIAQKQVEDRAAASREQGVTATLEAALQRWFTPAYFSANNSSVNKVRDWRKQTDPESYAQAAWVLANGVRELINPKPAISQPTLVMTCEQDSGSTPAMSRAIAREIVGAQIEIVPALQHLGLIENPDAIMQPMIKFLDQQLL